MENLKRELGERFVHKTHPLCEFRVPWRSKNVAGRHWRDAINEA